MSVAILLSGDLFIRSQVESQLAPDFVLHQVAQASGLEEECEARQPHLLLIDLSGPGPDWALIASLRTRNPSLGVVAFGPHVQAARLAEAREAGCDLVLTRGQMLQEGRRQIQSRWPGNT